jgi:hypothetical protein
MNDALVCLLGFCFLADRVFATDDLQAEKEKAEVERKAYINPELSDKVREEGNALYKVTVLARFYGSARLLYLTNSAP